MIGNTAIDQHLKRADSLFDSVAWFEANDTLVKTTILDLIRIKQLTEQGIDENQNIIGQYSAVTDMLTNGDKAEGDNFTLDDTGHFYRSMFVTVLKDSILIDADYNKMTDQNWWTIDILGLTDKNLEIYAQMVKQNFIRYARRILQIN
tara:strand:+ start:11550 stop:11993 length:444 start_codon:yes stop_codon:yes gene_type:complete